MSELKTEWHFLSKSKELLLLCKSQGEARNLLQLVSQEIKTIEKKLDNACHFITVILALLVGILPVKDVLTTVLISIQLTKILLRSVVKASEVTISPALEGQSELEQSNSDSSSLEYCFTKIASFLESTAPDIWQKTSSYFHDIVEDHRENLVPHYRKHGYEWIATCITCWRLLCFFVHICSKLLRVVLAPRRS